MKYWFTNAYEIVVGKTECGRDITNWFTTMDRSEEEEDVLQSAIDAIDGRVCKQIKIVAHEQWLKRDKRSAWAFYVQNADGVWEEKKKRNGKNG